MNRIFFIFVLLYCLIVVLADDFSMCRNLASENDVCAQQGLSPQCDSQIYCQGELLCTVQMARIFPDSKTFVDMKIKTSEAETLANFAAWKEAYPNATSEDVRTFVTVSEYEFVLDRIQMTWQSSKCGDATQNVVGFYPIEREFYPYYFVEKGVLHDLKKNTLWTNERAVKRNLKIGLPEHSSSNRHLL